MAFLKTNEGKNELKGFLFTMSVLVLLGSGYFYCIFFPVINEINKMATPQTYDQFVIFFSLLGFAICSLWFATVELPFAISNPINKKLGWMGNNQKPTLPKKIKQKEISNK